MAPSPDTTTALRMETVATEARLDEAFAWLCQRRQHYPDHADVWDLRRNWPRERARIRADLLANRYVCQLLDRVTLHGRDAGETSQEIDLCPARDAVVFKALALGLAEHLPSSPACTHRHGGLKAAVRQIGQQLGQYQYVCKTDVQSYYASIDHIRLMDQLARYIHDRRVLNLIGQYLRRRAERGGLIWEYRRGIPLGNPLSPVLAAFFLLPLDEACTQRGWCYVRYMDDIAILTPTRHTLRTAVKVVNQILARLGLAKHPGKTFIGRIAKGFSFLGYQFGPSGLRVAEATLQRRAQKCRQLYEQQPPGPERTARLGEYLRRWWGWVPGGLGELGPVTISAGRDPIQHQGQSRLAPGRPTAPELG